MTSTSGRCALSGQLEKTHDLQIVDGKSPAKPFTQIRGKALQQLVPIPGPLLACLFELKDSSAKFDAFAKTRSRAAGDDITC